jgi:hypothetical protein
VKQQGNDLTSAAVTQHLINELPKSPVVYKSFLYSLLAKLRELGEEELLWGWEISLHKLKLSELLQIVEV